MESTETLKKIHESAKKHFLANGFQRASLRKIVSDAGFTLGVFYGYYDSKEELFHALVEQTANGILTALSEMATTLNALPNDQKLAKMTEVFSSGMARLVDYLLEYRDENTPAAAMCGWNTVRGLSGGNDGTGYSVYGTGRRKVRAAAGATGAEVISPQLFFCAGTGGSGREYPGRNFENDGRYPICIYIWNGSDPSKKSW